MHSSHATRAHRSMMQSIADIDNEPTPPAIEISAELRAQALADYCADCRSSPESEWQDFSEYLLEWLDAKLYDDSISQWEEEMAAEVAAQHALEEMRRNEQPWQPREDDEPPF